MPCVPYSLLGWLTGLEPVCPHAIICLVCPGITRMFPAEPTVLPTLNFSGDRAVFRPRCRHAYTCTALCTHWPAPNRGRVYVTFPNR
jgi:hypothetical protein